MNRKLVLGLLLAFASMAVSFAMTEAQRRDYLEWMRKTLPDVPAWNEWQQKTGELPPDFDALPSTNALPDPLRATDGRAVRTAADWNARRAEIRQLLEKWDVGSIPPKPKLDKVTPVSETRGNGYVTRVVRLEYGPEDKITENVTVVLPDGDGPFPVLIGSSFGGRWPAVLIRRGYISASYNDSVDQKTNLPELYPTFDFATMGQRAWTAQMVVDYLYTLPQVDKAHIAITGYSRGGKMALTAAALDERIAAVVAGSTGVGGVLPWRLSGERGGGEGIESTTRMFPLWFTPRLRFFSGREDRLPVDANLLVSLVAPRGCLMEYGLNDEVSNPWSNEQSFQSAHKVYALLGHPERLGILRVPGFHGANDEERCVDWLDIQFGRSPRRWTNDFLFPWSYADWKARTGNVAGPGPTSTTGAKATSKEDWQNKLIDIRKAVTWTLGVEPPQYAPPAGGRGGFPGRGGATSTPTKPVANPGQLGPDVPGWVIGRNSIEFGWNDPDRSAAESRRIRFGANLTGDLYFPKDTPEGKKLPTVIWLHGYNYPLGYMWVYRRDLHPVLALVKAGYAVLAYDQCGFGSRMAEAGPFNDRWPQWSQFGRMVEDVRAAVDALSKDGAVDPEKISVFGYTIGGNVALHAASVDSRIKSVVAVCAFTPMRTDKVGFVADLSVTRGLLPRLGQYVGHEAQIPYDYDELIATLAPRPVYVVSPQRDRGAAPADVRTAVEKARTIYALFGAGGNVALDEPDDYGRLTAATQNRAIEWLKVH